MEAISQEPSWLDQGEYPFKNRFITLQAGRMHYVDEGEGQPILFIHGTPVWSFLYRRFIKHFLDRYRCIAVDHLGFGLSGKSTNFDGTPEWHAENLAEFMERLDLHNVILVVHDFGGPIGLGAAITHPGRIDRIVLLNSWLWETRSIPAARQADRIIRSFIGRFLYLRMNFSPRVLLKKAFTHRKVLSLSLHRQYLGPFPDAPSRYGLLGLAKALVGSSEWYASQWQRLDALTTKQWLIVWGVQDTFINVEFLERWIHRIPEARVYRLECGHFVQEEKPEECIASINAFINES